MIVKKIIPVVHVVDFYQTQENVKICLDCGIDKLFLINHLENFDHLKNIYEKIKETNNDLWIGVNFLDLSLENAIKFVEKNKFDALWHDEFPKTIKEKPKFDFYPCVSFKYQPKIENLYESCKKIEKIADVVVTSGEKTGSAPTLEKIKNIRKNIQQHVPIAIASGINYYNILTYVEFVDYFLVASSIIEKNEIFSYKKLFELKNRLERNDD